MSTTWTSGDAPDPVRLGVLGWVLAALRGLPLAVLIFGCLGLLLLTRLIERPLNGAHRPWTPRITTFVCRNAFRLLGIGFSASGEVVQGAGAIVANHSSWLDIFALNACARIYFVSKSEVAGWPGIGWLARATGTVFIERNPARARQQTELFEDRLRAGHHLTFFPEGTSSDGLRVLPFKTTLFASFFAEGLRETLQIQPAAVIYHAPAGASRRFYGWWGDMAFGPHLLQTLGARRQGRVEVRFLPPVRVADFSDRKALAAHVEAAVRRAHEDALPGLAAHARPGLHENARHRG